MKVRKILQIGLTPIRCASCNALLCQASSNSVISIVCGRCSAHTIVEASQNMPPNTTSQVVPVRKR